MMLAHTYLVESRRFIGVYISSGNSEAIERGLTHLVRRPTGGAPGTKNSPVQSSVAPLPPNRSSQNLSVCPYLGIASAFAAKERPCAIKSGLNLYRRLCKTQYRHSPKGKRPVVREVETGSCRYELRSHRDGLSSQKQGRVVAGWSWEPAERTQLSQQIEFEFLYFTTANF